MIEKVKSLTLGVFRLQFREVNEPDKELPDNTLVEDFGFPLDATHPWQPQWVMKGWFQKINHFSKNLFIIDEFGPETLYITGIPNEVEIPENPDMSKYIEVWKEQNNGTKYIIRIV